jgi:hypothetical protein
VVPVKKAEGLFIYIDNISVEKYERKRPLGRHRRRWEDNVRMDIRAVGWKGLDWMRLAQDKTNCGPLRRR